MANPADVGTFDVWITDRLAFQTVKPKTGDTGDFDSWITDRLYWHDYVETEAAGVAPQMMHYARLRRA